ncbi:type II restriction/modification system DNA methylase subunit YeeA [Borreliella kurtenbachii]
MQYGSKNHEISTLSPKNSYYTSTLNVNYEKSPISLYKKLFIISIFNSLSFDFLLRRFVNIALVKSCLYQCLMPQPKEKDILANPLYLTLVKYRFVNSQKRSFKFLKFDLLRTF